MSITNQMWRNIRRSDPYALQERPIIPPNRRQKELTEKYVIPNHEAIQYDAGILRKYVDRQLRKRSDVKELHGEMPYPTNCCREVTRTVFRLLLGMLLDRSYTGFSSVHNFIRCGGIVKIAWGIKHDRAFHNAIQLGSSILDVAHNADEAQNDEVSIAFYPDLYSAPIRMIRDFVDMANIMEQFWGYDIFPNYVFPWFAPTYPIIAVHREYDIRLESHAEVLAWPNLTTEVNDRNSGLAWQFIFASEYANKVLPSDVCDHLFRLNSNPQILARFNPEHCWMSADPDDAQSAFWEYYKINTPHEGSNALIRTIRNLRVFSFLPNNGIMASFRD